MNENNRYEASNAPLNGLRMLTAIGTACLDSKGKDLAVLDVSEVFSLSDYFVIVSARSDRQVQGISNKIIASLEKSGVKPLAVEGVERAHWVLLDFGEVLVHVFYEPVRQYYDLESLWVQARRLDLEKDLKLADPDRQAA